MFENTVMSLIGHHLKNGETAEFTNGTLFINSSKDTALAMYIDLCNRYRKRNVKFNTVTSGKTHGEFTVDFLV
jgi:hypothetical protein